ncbi:bifunctional sugar-1-phosphate nucleotidylyltransferase/acetyltransferase [uncultured Methanofollis sp.]|uniref:bifunctional sugar-1-phosphate nucleotidylyltransferase/acetyltransferase n=1 Tax=uncultured Methanofollis sp. TaxID=262500 RepID=UPI00261CB825|nr:bifunctional sugar-1-phosphate nucleotidylyltransferase/acetyltransferase [uncultured Methanofollis sp.]
MQAVILAAGEGKRLRPLTHTMPKAMVPVANRPILEYIIRALEKNGIREIIVVVGYKKEHVIRHLNTLDVPVRVVVQEKQLGTAHALACAAPLITGDFLLLPGDNYVDTASIARIMREKNAVLTWEHPHPSNFGVLVIKDGLVKEVIEKPQEAPGFTVSTGIFSLDPSFLRYLEETEIPDAVNRMIRAGTPLKAVAAADWQDAVYPWDLLKLNAALLRDVRQERAGRSGPGVVIRGRVSIGKGTTIGPNTTIMGPAVIGDDCDIGANCVVMPETSIGARVRVEPFTMIGQSVVLDDVNIGSHSRITEAVVGTGSHLGDHATTFPTKTIFSIEREMIGAKFGAIIGDQMRSAPFCIFRNCIVGNDVVIDDGKTIYGEIPDGAKLL